MLYTAGMDPTPTAHSSPAEPAGEKAAAEAFAEAVAIMARLRAPGGCPWDREQTFASIRKYTLEEVYEVLEAIERADWPELEEELGDLLLQVLFYAQIASEEGYFHIAGVVAGLNRKLVRRHPHVFGEEAAAAAGNAAPGLTTDGIDAPQVLRNWEAIKQAEKLQTETKRGGSVAASRLAAVSRALPALAEAAKLGSRASKCGFDWPEVEGLFEKLREETAELREALAGETGTPDQENSRQAAVAGELGDLLFTAVNLARHLHVDPEMALRDANAKFRRRFAAMEAAAPGDLEALPAAELEALWNRAKAEERTNPSASPATPSTTL